MAEDLDMEESPTVSDDIDALVDDLFSEGGDSSGSLSAQPRETGAAGVTGSTPDCNSAGRGSNPRQPTREAVLSERDRTEKPSPGKKRSHTLKPASSRSRSESAGPSPPDGQRPPGTGARKCPMYSPRGTRCPVCGKVHPV